MGNTETTLDASAVVVDETPTSYANASATPSTTEEKCPVGDPIPEVFICDEDSGYAIPGSPRLAAYKERGLVAGGTSRLATIDEKDSW